MPERASLHQGVQVGVEVTPGTAVSANKKLQSISIDPSISADIKTFRPMGGKFSTLAAIGKEWTKAKLSGQLVYTDVVYLLSSCMSYAAPAQQAATAAYKWTFAPGQSDVDTVKTFTVEAGGSVRAHKMAYGLCNQFGYKITRDEANVSGEMMGQRLTDGITLTASPTSLALQPVLPTQVNVYLDGASGDLGTTQLLRALAVDFELADRFGPVWPLDSSQASYATHVETEPKATFKLLMEADSVGMGLLTHMRSSAKRFLRVAATGPVIEGAYNYSFIHDLCGIVSEVSEFSDQDGVYAIEWTFNVTYDATWTKAMQLEVINTLTGL